MPKHPKTNLGKSIKRRLEDDLNQTQAWLCERVSEDAGLYFDDSYLHKIMTGKNRNPKIIASVCKILDIDPSIAEKEVDHGTHENPKVCR